MGRIRIEGLDIAYERRGSGPALVLLHGYVGDAASTWQPQLEGLSGHFTVVAWDAPGAGGSSDPPEAFGMAGYADCLAGFIDALGLRRPHVLGLSFGGALALALQGRHPGVASSLVLASAEDLRAVLPRVDVPTLLVYGDRDVRAPLEVAHALRAGIRSATLTVLEGCGHLVNLEAPDRFNRVVADFLRDVPGRQVRP